MKPAILFDIDGTLLYAKGLGRPAFAEAFREAYGVAADFDHVSFVGATDTAVVRAMADHHGILSTPKQEEHFFIELSHRLGDALKRTPPLVYPGVDKLLNALCERGYVLGVVTGNIRATAWAKLLTANLAQYFTFGAYGCDHPDRNTIATIAQARAKQFNADAVLLVGDTVKDIQAAHTLHLPALTVTASGWVESQTLLEAGAEACLPSFDPLDRTLQTIEDLRHASARSLR